ncbi:MAG: hypothetical protein CL723_02550 [Chloroflexi bacterium]|jgi:hypothetical protein|nr:hypothetical protein [Chloroflexota bacterium]|tara:strand:- start:3341 stop:3976 length:636 start_codon:yes stop_codon:yes gene_type:complete
MLSKKLIGSLMFLGPLLGIAMAFIEPAGMSEDSFAVKAQTMIDNSALTMISSMGFALAVMAIFIGIHYLARSMQGEDKPGSDLAGIASVFALLIVGVVMVSFGIEITVGEKESSWIGQGGDVVNALAISEAISQSVFFFNGVVILLLGIAIIRQKNLNQIVGGLFILFGACIVVGGIFSVGDNIGGMIWLTGFLGWLLTTIATGILIIRSA